MDALYVTITREQFFRFHDIDRRLYRILAMQLFRDPEEAFQIMAFWICLERFSFRNTVHNILGFQNYFINEMAEEAVTCLIHLNLATAPFHFLPYHHISEIPLTEEVIGKSFSLRFLYQNWSEFRFSFFQVRDEVCEWALSDILKVAKGMNSGGGSTTAASGKGWAVSPLLDPILQKIGQLKISSTSSPPRRPQPDERTLLVTFSRGYPVSGEEIREFFTKSYGGDCIDSLRMQEVKAAREQPLYVRIVLRSVSTIQSILRGMERVKFLINRKCAWMRKFVPRENQGLPEPSRASRRPTGARSSGGFPALAP